MNEQQLSGGTKADRRFLDAWEHVPRDGPGVLVVDTEAYDNHGTRWGQWIDPTQPIETIERDIEHAVGTDSAQRGSWAIIDQTGLGEAMIPEQLSVTALHRHALHRTDAKTLALPGQPTTEVVSPVEHFATLPGEFWDSTAALAIDFITSSGVLGVVEGLPDEWDEYVTFDLDKLGHDLAVTLGGIIDTTDGSVFMPETES